MATISHDPARTDTTGVRGAASVLGRIHREGLALFAFVSVAHVAEHAIQAMQIWVLDRPRPESRGIIGQAFPALIRSEALHLGYAVVMMLGLVVLARGFTGRSATIWRIALAIQVWHLVEHVILGMQAWSSPWFGRPVPTSILQLFFQRAEVHLVYNAIVLVPAVIGMVLHVRAARTAPGTDCNCVPARSLVGGALPA